MLASFSAQAIMVSVMNLAGYVVVEQHHHAQDKIFPFISAHVFGMYVLVLVVGAAVLAIAPAAWIVAREPAPEPLGEAG